jgi:hypothetical protein
MKAFVAIKMLQAQLKDLEKDAIKFDKKRVDVAGQRLRVELQKIKKKIIQVRNDIQEIRYYREAWNVYHGKKEYIENKEIKEKKYGSVAEIAKLQIAQKRRF